MESCQAEQTERSKANDTPEEPKLEEQPCTQENQLQIEPVQAEGVPAEAKPAHATSNIAPEAATGDLGNGDSVEAIAGSIQDPSVPQWSSGQAAEEQDLIPDDIDADSDSALGSDTCADDESTTTSIAESVYHFRMEYGRTYHAYKDGKYIFPNDEREIERLDLQHAILKITYGQRLFFSPLRNPKRCLDIGTGTGIWAIEFADQFPDCEVIGTDLSPNQPNLVPPNCSFIIDDAEDEWLFDHKFDFVHLRLMSGSFSDFPKLFQQAFENMEPGGWIELQDYGLPVRSFDGTHEQTSVKQWGELLCEASLKQGKPLGSDAVDNYAVWLRNAGFVDIRQNMFMWPTNGWPRDPMMKMIGRWNQINITDGLEGFCLALLIRGLGWKKEEVDVFVARVARDLRDRSIHAYFPMPVTYARKPRLGESWFR